MSAFVDGTLVADNGVMQTLPLADGQSVPAGAVFVNGIAHAQAGQRYIAPWPASNAVTYHAGRAVRHDGAQIVAESITPTVFLKGIGMSARGETFVATGGDSVNLAGFAVTFAGALVVSAGLASGFNVKSAAGVSYSTTRNVLSSSGVSYAVSGSVLSSSGVSYNVI